MPIDTSQFHQAFFDETEEHLSEMERLLLNLQVDAPNKEDLNAIFRAVHSIKGASNTFGFTDLGKVSHVLESVLDRLRNGTMTLRNEMVDLFLTAGDVLKGQLAGHKEGAAIDPQVAAQAADVCERLKTLSEEKETKGLGNAATGSLGKEGTTQGEDPGYGFFEEVSSPPSAPAAQSDLADLADRADPGYGFFDDVSPAASSKAPELTTRSPGGRRVSDHADPAEEPVRSGRRASDKMVVSSEASSIRVSVEKVDQLINQVGELVITQAMLSQTAALVDPEAYERLQGGLAQLERNTRDLQESVMGIRMVPIGVVFSRFPRMIRDLAGKLSKQVELKTYGEETELDKSLIEKLVDPLTHLVRNSLDHGVESPEQRAAAGKGPKGVITLRASHQGGSVLIEVSDDGAGLNRERILAKAKERALPASEAMSDQEVWQLIFLPGFSTAAVVTDVSGRGVGMDVVKRNVQAMGGRVEIQSETGRGSKISIRLPLTLAIIEGMTVRVGREIYIAPLTSIIESVRPKRSEIKTIVGKGEVVEVRGDYIPIARLHQLFEITPDLTDPTQAVLVIAESGGEKVAILVDALVGQQQVVIKSMEENFQKVEGIAGATILGDGQVAFILDVQGLFVLSQREETTLVKHET